MHFQYISETGFDFPSFCFVPVLESKLVLLFVAGGLFFHFAYNLSRYVLALLESVNYMNLLILKLITSCKSANLRNCVDFRKT